MNNSADLTIDYSNAQALINQMKSIMKPKQFENAMYGVLRRTAAHVKTILSNDLPKEYVVERKDVKSATQSPQFLNSGAGLGCTIPVTGKRRTVGGNHIKAKGSLYGWDTVRKPPYTITAQIVTTGESVLPSHISGKGNNPPFRNVDPHNQSRVARKIGAATYTRNRRSRFPIEAIKTLAIPQMVTTRSRDNVQDDVSKYLEGRVYARIQAFIKNGR